MLYFSLDSGIVFDSSVQLVSDKLTGIDIMSRNMLTFLNIFFMANSYVFEVTRCAKIVLLAITIASRSEAIVLFSVFLVIFNDKTYDNKKKSRNRSADCGTFLSVFSLVSLSQVRPELQDSALRLPCS